MTQRAEANPTGTLTVSIANTLRQQYLLDTDVDRRINLCFLHQCAQTSSDISILIIARADAIVNLSATVSIPANTPDCRTNLRVQVITMGNAIVTASPDLEIANNQVAASHSLSTVHLGDSELFYLANRGIGSDQARKLLIQGYLDKFDQAIRL